MALHCSMIDARGAERMAEMNGRDKRRARGWRAGYFAAQTNLASDVLLWTPVFVRMAWA